MIPQPHYKERLQGTPILIVDDLELNRRMLEHALHSRGFTHIITAHDGAKALQLTRQYQPGLVILDLLMPGMDGFAYLEAIRQEKLFDTMPILVQTVLDEPEKKMRAFKLGATDYICKPLHADELEARVNIHLMQRLMLGDLGDYQNRMQSEIEQAREMQARLMPGATQISRTEREFAMSIASHFEPSQGIGGDCWGMRALDGQRLAIYQFDFSGHGISAAMNVFRIHTLIEECITSASDPGKFLSTLNEHLHPLLSRDEFATMFYGVIDIEANCLLYASAAMHSALLFSQQAVSKLSMRSFPLGTLSEAPYVTQYTPFFPGDLLLLYSDCLIETPNRHGAFLTEQDIELCLLGAQAENRAHPARHICDSLVHRLASHRAFSISDDLTISVFNRL